ncbi:hypothetical protein T07_8673 [Trichinella nelsoni]|uniref:Uncharacterized protein n=1 Tax=Trichinella nelsoni TaxID=6336 RepID=A0A0V0S873_9BILA|nr:hypothetical protein T07_8673 [Trichinella nelsoni]
MNKHSNTLCIHCAYLCLNVTITKSSEVQAIWSCFGEIREVGAFFKWSFIRSTALKTFSGKLIAEDILTTKAIKCEITRWKRKWEKLLLEDRPIFTALSIALDNAAERMVHQLEVV